MDDIRRYVDLRDSLIREKAQLEERLRQINQALGDTAPPPAAPSPSAPSPAVRRGRPPGSRRRGRPAASGMSLREAVLQATSGKPPMSKQEILDAVQNLGYRFSTKNPMNSLGVILYGKNPKFTNEGGRFSPVGGGAAAPASAPAAGNEDRPSSGPFKRRKRNLSPEARERIAAAQRERWAKSRGAQ